MLSSVTRRFASLLLALAAAGTWGCAAPDSAGVLEPSAPQVSLGGDVLKGLGGTLERTGGIVGRILGLAECKPLPLMTGIALVGPRGGSLRVGAYQLDIPAGALNRTVLISMTQVAGPINSTRLSPHGLQFSRPARLTMSYENCDPNPSGGTNKILYVTESLHAIEAPPSRDNKRQNEVEALIDHFSRYAVAW